MRCFSLSATISLDLHRPTHQKSVWRAPPCQKLSKRNAPLRDAATSRSMLGEERARRSGAVHARNADEKTGRERCDEKEDATARRRREHAHQLADVAASARSRTALVTAALTSCHTRRSDSTDACAPG